MNIDQNAEARLKALIDYLETKVDWENGLGGNGIAHLEAEIRKARGLGQPVSETFEPLDPELNVFLTQGKTNDG